MPPASSSRTPLEKDLLRQVGAAVRARREALGLTRAEVAERAGLSVRFLAQVEQGEGNVAVTRLFRMARALGVEMSDLLPAPRGEAATGRRPVLALIGLRGAGKSSIGAAVARALGFGFVEHDALVEARAGMDLGEIFSIHGDAYYREMARRTLLEVLGPRGPEEPMVLAASGGIVTDEEAFEELLARAHVVWLTAHPEEHWQRVAAQGDMRPMEEHPDAMAALRRLHQERARLYARAPHHVHTTGRSPGDVAAEVRALAESLLLAKERGE